MIIYEAMHDDYECADSLGYFTTREAAQKVIDSLEFRISDLGVFENEVHLFLGDFLIDWGTHEEMEKLQETYDRSTDFFIHEIHIQE